jgi:4-hydroxybenzoate polyprenyltransferase
VRTASLASRARRNPIGRWHWIGVGAAGILLIGAIAARGWAQPFADDGEALRWKIALGCAILVVGLTFVIQPLAIRSALQEAEPLDARGSPQLVRMYDDYRQTRIRGLFWLLGVALPLLMAGCMAIAVWWPASGAMLGWMGGVGGSVLGLGGAWFGVVMSLRRVRINEVKMTLDAQGAGDSAPPSGAPAAGRTPRTMSPDRP